MVLLTITATPADAAKLELNAFGGLGFDGYDPERARGQLMIRMFRKIQPSVQVAECD